MMVEKKVKKFLSIENQSELVRVRASPRREREKKNFSLKFIFSLARLVELAETSRLV